MVIKYNYNSSRRASIVRPKVAVLTSENIQFLLSLGFKIKNQWKF